VNEKKMQMKKNKKILDDVRYSDLYIKQYDRKIKTAAPGFI